MNAAETDETIHTESGMRYQLSSVDPVRAQIKFEHVSVAFV
jgi:hypothetical protein